MARARFIDFVDTYSAAYRRSTFLENRGFDTSFPGDSSGEDQEFSFRLSERGYKMLFVPGAAVYHRHPPAVAAYYRRKYKTGYWKALVLRLHPHKAVRDTHTPALLKVQMGLLAMSLPVIGIGALAGIGAWALLLMAAALGLSYAPFTVKAWRKDKAIGDVAPFMLTVRAAALGTGLLRGVWHSWRRTGALGDRLPARTQDGSRE
jgi:hypothetical protein